MRALGRAVTGFVAVVIIIGMFAVGCVGIGVLIGLVAFGYRLTGA